jgi:transcriptional regulator with XRE-family HTH domain
VDDRQAGSVLRILRRRRRLRQADAAALARISQSTWSRIERGQLDDQKLETVRAAFGCLGARVAIEIRWRGGEIERVQDSAHAELIERLSALLLARGWTAVPEVTYSHYGERGSLDLLALLPSARAAAVFEIKSEVASVEATNRKHDEKVRLVAGICEERYGWRPRAVGRILVLPERERHRIERHALTFRAAYPRGTRELRQWLRQPDGPASGIWFLTPSHPGTVRPQAVNATPWRVPPMVSSSRASVEGER